MKELKEVLESKENIVALLAVYEANRGNCTKLVLENNKTVLLKQSVKSIIKNIAKYYSIDIVQLRKKQQNLLNSKYNVPLPIKNNMLFIPIKTRAPKVKKDPCCSYINFYQIHKLDKKAPIIHMKNNDPIQSLNSISTLKTQYNKGKICSKLNDTDNKNKLSEEKENLPYFYPATKADINTVVKEVESLKELVISLLNKKQ